MKSIEISEQKDADSTVSENSKSEDKSVSEDESASSKSVGSDDQLNTGKGEATSEQEGPNQEQNHRQLINKQLQQMKSNLNDLNLDSLKRQVRAAAELKIKIDKAYEGQYEKIKNDFEKQRADEVQVDSPTLFNEHQQEIEFKDNQKPQAPKEKNSLQTVL